MQNQAGFNWAFGVKIVGGTSFTIVGYSSDLSVPQSADALDTTTRNDNGYKNSVQGLKSWKIMTKHLWVPSDAAWAMIRAAYLAGSSLVVQVLDNIGITNNGVLTASTAYASLTVLAMPVALPIGTSITIGTAAQHDTWVLSAACKVGDTTLAVTSLAPTHSYAAGAAGQIGALAAAGHTGTVIVTKMDEKQDMKEVFLDIEFNGQGPLTDI